MGLPADLLRDRPYLDEWCILAGWRGSIAHGMFVKNSDPNSIDDKDAIFICVPPLTYFMGLKEFGSRGTKEIKKEEYDIVVYEVRKFVGLLAKGNPNVLSLLWLTPEYYLKKTDAGQLLIDNREMFATRLSYKSFVGYAHGQLHRMTHCACAGYMGKKRKQLVDKYGYDCKNAAHLIRILRMGIEFLTIGELHVLRHDAQQLLEIKRGEWQLERVQAEADRLFKVAEEAFIKSPLPKGPDREKISELCVKVVQTHMGEEQ